MPEPSPCPAASATARPQSTVTPISVGVDGEVLEPATKVTGTRARRALRRASITRAACGVRPPTSTPAMRTPSGSLSGEPANARPTTSRQAQANRRRRLQMRRSAGDGRAPPGRSGRPAAQSWAGDAQGPCNPSVRCRSRGNDVGIERRSGRFPVTSARTGLGYGADGLRPHVRAAAAAGDGPRFRRRSGAARRRRERRAAPPRSRSDPGDGRPRDPRDRDPGGIRRRGARLRLPKRSPARRSSGARPPSAR